MKLLLITAVSDFEKEIKQLLKKVNVKSYSYNNVKGVSNTTTEELNSNWFGAEHIENDSVVFYVFVDKEKVDHFFEQVDLFNSKLDSVSKIHLASFNIEKHN